jgi:hypothetical protein
VSIFIDLHSSLFLTHPAETLVDTLKFAFRKLAGFIVTEELLGDTALGFFLGQALGTHIILIRDYSTDLEVLRKFFRVISFVETIGVNEIPEFKSLEVGFKLLGQFDLGHLPPGTTSCLFTFFSSFFGFQFQVIQRRDCGPGERDVIEYIALFE